MSVLRQVLLDNPAGYWPLDEASGSTAFDQSGNGRNGTYTNGPVPNAASYAGNPAADFDGVNDFVDVPYNAVFDSLSFSVECWSYMDTIVSNAAFMSKQGSWILDDTATFYLLQSSGSFWRYAQFNPATLPSGALLHLAATFDSAANAFTMYKNGVAQPTLTGGPSGSRNTTATNLWIGRYPGFGYLDGRIFHAAYYPSVLSAARVAAHFQEGIRGGVVHG